MITIYEGTLISVEEDCNRLDLCNGDADMSAYYKIAEWFKQHANFVKYSEGTISPISVYTFRDIEFWLMFDDMIDEPFISVDKKYDYEPIRELANECLNEIKGQIAEE